MNHPTSRRPRSPRPATMLALATAILCAHFTLAEDAPPAAPQGYVTREEYELLLREQRALREELQAMRRERDQERSTTRAAPTAISGGAATSTESPRPSTPTTDDVEAQIRAIQRDLRDVKGSLPGFQQLVFAGDFSVGFTQLKHDDSTFSATFSPLILWRPADKLLIETALDVGIDTDPASGSSTSVDLTIADAIYEVNDALLIGGGLFVVPFGVYHNHFDPPWINKFPDDPLPFADGGIAPGSEVGLFARGAVPAGNMKFTYDVYVTNGPQLVVHDPGAAGSLNFDDFTDLNGDKAVGGRLGWLPRPDMEMGYSIQASQPNPSGFKRVHALLQAVDFNYRPDVPAIGGVLDLRGEYVWSDVSRATFDPKGTLGFGPLTFSNHSEGAYAQIAYRPIHLPSDFLRKLEFVARYDFLNTPLRAPFGDHERRWTLGLDYWLAPNAVLKFAYEFDHRKTGENQNGFLAQFALGF